jgi:hypothetical protein
MIYLAFRKCHLVATEILLRPQQDIITNSVMSHDQKINTWAMAVIFLCLFGCLAQLVSVLLKYDVHYKNLDRSIFITQNPEIQPFIAVNGLTLAFLVFVAITITMHGVSLIKI